MRGEEMPGNLTLAGQKAFLALRMLYAQHRTGALSYQTAKDEKTAIVRAYETERSAEKALDQDVKALAGRIRRAADTYLQAPSLEHADAMYAAFFRLPESWRREQGNFFDE